MSGRDTWESHSAVGPDVASWEEGFGMLGLVGDAPRRPWGDQNVVVMPAYGGQRSFWFESGCVLRKIQIPLKKLISLKLINETFYCPVSVWFTCVWLSVWMTVHEWFSQWPDSCLFSVISLWGLVPHTSLSVLLLFNNAYYKGKTCPVPLKVCLPFMKLCGSDTSPQMDCTFLKPAMIF